MLALDRTAHRLLHGTLANAIDDYLFILVLIGDSGVGKSCLLLRFAVRRPPMLAASVSPWQLQTPLRSRSHARGDP